jgi:hypothetical protein
MSKNLVVKGKVNLGDRSVVQVGTQNPQNELPSVKINSASGTITTIPAINFSNTSVTFDVHNKYVKKSSVVLVSLMTNNTGYLLLVDVSNVRKHHFTVRISDVQSAVMLPGASYTTNEPVKIGFLVC